MNHYHPEKNGKELCPECGFPMRGEPKGNRVWKGVNICYSCFKQHIRDNTIDTSIREKRNVYKKRWK